MEWLLSVLTSAGGNSSSVCIKCRSGSYSHSAGAYITVFAITRVGQAVAEKRGHVAQGMWSGRGLEPRMAQKERAGEG
jgi:hypothetical protein